MFPDTKTLFAASEIHLNYTVYQEIQVHKKMQIVTNKRYTCRLLLPCNLKHNGFTLTVNIIHCNGYRVRNCAEVIKWFFGAGTKPKLPVILKKSIHLQNVQMIDDVVDKTRNVMYMEGFT